MTTKIGPCLLMILTTTWIANGLSIKKCDHDQFANQVEQFTSCLNLELSGLVDQFLKDYKAQVRANNNSFDLKKECPVIQKHTDNVAKCTVSLTSSCFDDKITDLVKHAFNGISIFCENLQYLIKPVSFPPDKIRIWTYGFDRQRERLTNLTNLLEGDKKCDRRKSRSASRKMGTCIETASKTLTKPFERHASQQIPQHVK